MDPTHINQSLNDTYNVYILLRVIVLPIYAVYFYNTMYQPRYSISPYMRKILIGFLLLMVVRLVYDISIMLIYKTNDTNGYTNAQRQSYEQVIRLKQYRAGYNENRMSIILMYGFLLQIKQA